MTAYKWDRPSLPPDNKSALIGSGVGLAITGAGLIMLSFTDAGADAMAAVLLLYFGAGGGSLGLPIIFVGLILNELRLQAFERAIETGKVQKVKSNDAASKHLPR